MDTFFRHIRKSLLYNYNTCGMWENVTQGNLDQRQQQGDMPKMPGDYQQGAARGGEIMKTLILIAMIGTAAAAGETNQVYLMDNDPTIKTVCEIGKAQAGSVSLSDPASLDKASMTNCIKAWAKAGEICKLYGHRWQGTTLNIVYTSYPPQYPPRERTCTMCGKREIHESIDRWIDGGQGCIMPPILTFPEGTITMPNYYATTSFNWIVTEDCN